MGIEGHKVKKEKKDRKEMVRLLRLLQVDSLILKEDRRLFFDLKIKQKPNNTYEYNSLFI